jgi:uncharacterized MAPEG superfamily protein
MFGLSAPGIFLYTIVAAAALIYLPYGVVAYGRFKVGFDIGAPRACFDKLPDYAKRATWAHQNSFESFTVFAVAALAAFVTNQTDAGTVWAAIAYIPARFLYCLFYILNIPIGRSLMFGVGSLCILSLLVASLKAVS